MHAQILTIEDKVRPRPFALVSLAGFQYREGKAVDPRIVLQQPDVSVYCLDHENKRAIFVRTPLDLSEAPFYFQAQYQAAQQLIALPYEMLHELAGEVEIDPRRIILIYSVGRCGSTLVSHAFNQAEGVITLSEPDVFTQILTLREAEISKLIYSCTKLMAAAAAHSGKTLALKFRSYVIELGDIFYRHFPEAKVIFLYRHAESWARSVARVFRLFDPQMAQMLPQLQADFSRLVPFVAEYSAKNEATISPVELLTRLWVSAMERCLALQRQGVPTFPVRYEELKAAPREVLDAMFAYCGVSAKSPKAIEGILAKDSQAGTSFSRASVLQSGSELQEHHVVEMRRLMRELSNTLTPDFIVPNTFLISESFS